MRLMGVVLAAGSATRFGSAKQLAPLAGRPLLQHPLDALAAAGIDDVIVVLGEEAPAIEAAIAWRSERRRVNERARAADAQPTRSFVRPRYAGDAAPNPVLVRRAAWPMAAGLDGDRGLGPLLARNPELVLEVPVGGAIPDVDTPADLAAVEAAR
jgi:molybdenum cofactor cytidylyltransferase